MNNFTKSITPYVQDQLSEADRSDRLGNVADSFVYLENAHVLGQESTYWHVKVHYLMLRWAIKQHDINEVIGQIIRIIGAALLTAIKGVPTGNTGGSNVSPVKVMPIKPEHAEIIAKVKNDISTS
ncbi:DUF3703 domain-containing protein [Shewanella sp. SR41-2]|nr:DUF3703 domain-containing protein [Shewanella sp. SR41-2]